MQRAVQASGVRKSYPQGEGELEVLKGIELVVSRGEWVSIMGPSGSGKSTLLNLIGLLDSPTSGHLALTGRDVSALSVKQAALARRDFLGFIFQSFNLMPRMTALQNVMLPMAIAAVPRAERKARAARLLQQVGLGDRVNHRPAQLSGGQKQRVAVARALALDPPILLADEPTGNLDTKTGAEIMALFDRLHKAGKTIIQVTHDEDIAHHAQRIIRVRDGVIEREEQGRRKGPVVFSEAPIPDAKVMSLAPNPKQTKSAQAAPAAPAVTPPQANVKAAAGAISRNTNPGTSQPAAGTPAPPRGAPKRPAAPMPTYPHPLRKEDDA